MEKKKLLKQIIYEDLGILVLASILNVIIFVWRGEPEILLTFTGWKYVLMIIVIAIARWAIISWRTSKGQ